eukprot:1384529-Pyramimonas_sp.AAC.1
MSHWMPCLAMPVEAAAVILAKATLMEKLGTRMPGLAPARGWATRVDILAVAHGSARASRSCAT